MKLKRKQKIPKTYKERREKGMTSWKMYVAHWTILSSYWNLEVTFPSLSFFSSHFKCCIQYSQTKPLTHKRGENVRKVKSHNTWLVTIDAKCWLLKELFTITGWRRPKHKRTQIQRNKRLPQNNKQNLQSRNDLWQIWKEKCLMGLGKKWGVGRLIGVIFLPTYPNSWLITHLK